MADCKTMTNSEIKLKMKSLEDEYNVKKEKAANLLARLARLDEEYIELREELNNRTKMGGFINGQQGSKDWDGTKG